MKSIEPFLSFNGNCEEAFKFYSSVFNQNIAIQYRYKDLGASANFPESIGDLICYINIPLSDHISLVGSDATSSSEYTEGSNMSVCINVKTEEEAESLYSKLSEEGFVIMPLEKTEWAKLYAYFKDKFGIYWMINLSKINEGEEVNVVEPYLRFNGNCEEVFNFYSQVFNQKVSRIFRFKDFEDTKDIPDSDLNLVSYINLPISKYASLLGSDSLSNTNTVVGNSLSIMMNTENIEETKAIYEKLSQDGIIIMPLGATQWSEQYAWLIDKFGIYWSIDMLSPDRK